MKTRGLLWQLFPVNLLITLGAVVIMTWYAAGEVRSIHLEQMRQGLSSRASLIAAEVKERIRTSPESLQEFCRSAGRQASTRITVVAPDGTVLGDSSEDPARMTNHANRPEIVTALNDRTGSSIRFSNTVGRNMLYVAIPLSTPRDELLGVLRVAVPVSAIDGTIHTFYFKAAGVCLIVILFAGLITLVFTRRIVHPLEEMKRGAERIARGDTEHLIETDTTSMSTEVYALARSLNRMAKQIRERINTITLQHKELQTVFSSMTEMVLAIDRDKRIIRLNRAAAALFYLSPTDVKGKPLQGVIRNKDLHEIVGAVLENGEAVERDIVMFVGPDKIYLQTRAVPLEDEKKNPIGVLVVLNDMTRLHKLETMRRDFVANVSHELKTPVTSIRGYVETLQEGALENPDDARRFLEVIDRQASRLDAIIDDLLTLSRIELSSDRDRISLVRSRVKEILDSALLTCLPGAEKKNIKLELSCGEHLHARFNPNLIEQAVVNLVSNAVTYSPEKSVVHISAALRKEEEVSDRLLISVADQGVGIEKKHLDRLFERFYRTDKARSSASGGTGLGLSIVKHIAVAHGGSVSVESEPGHGSTFTLVIPQ
ncbi:MAG: ATP-binding protein [Desulfobulbaceae bacterium]